MPSTKLTKSVVDTAKPTARDYEMRDTIVPRFLRKITPAGRRTFMLSYRSPKKPMIELMLTIRLALCSRSRSSTAFATRIAPKEFVSKTALASASFDSSAPATGESGVVDQEIESIDCAQPAANYLGHPSDVADIERQRLDSARNAGIPPACPDDAPAVTVK